MTQPSRTKFIALLLLVVTLTSITITACGDDSGNKTPNTPVQELFSLIPDSPNALKMLVFNDYAALKSLHNFPAKTTFAEVSKQADLFSRYNEISRPLAFSRLSDGANNDLEALPSLVGYDFFQIDQDAEAGVTPQIISVAKGEFDYAAIDKAFTTASATKGKIGTFTSYGFDKLDFKNPIQLKFLNVYNNLVVVPDKKFLLTSPDSATAKASVSLIEKPNNTSVKDNPGVKALLENFGNPKSILITNQIASRLQFLNSNPRFTAEQLKALEEEIKKTPLPVPLLGGYSYVEDKPGEGVYIVANYYSEADAAKQAVSVMEKILKEGTSNSSRRPFSDYFQVISAEAKGQVALYKLKTLDKKLALRNFIANRDFPILFY